MRHTPTPRPGACRRILVAAAILGLAATGTVTAAAAEQPSGALTLDEPSPAVLMGDRTVTLLTGERMTVSADPSGRLSVTALGGPTVDPRSADGPARASDLQVTGIEAPGRPMALSAVPPHSTVVPVMPVTCEPGRTHPSGRASSNTRCRSAR